jgi:hypothetical protein
MRPDLVSMVVKLTAKTIRAGLNESALGLSNTESMSHLQPKRMTTLSVGSRIQALTAIACFVAMVGCGEPTGPRTFCCAEKPEQADNRLAVLAPELHDAADVFAEGVSDATLRGQAELAVNRLADQLLAGKVSGSRAALAQARSMVANVDDIQAIELAPVGLALDYIEARIDQILAGAQ